MLVNIVSKIPPALWDREVPSGLSIDFCHTYEPVSADIHVIYGIRNGVVVPNKSQNTIFIASEPPEIREYNKKVVSTYRAVLGPGFEYLKQLSNFTEIEAVAPWWVGARAGGADHYQEFVSDISLSRPSLAAVASPDADRVSVIVSGKSRTPLQRQRLKLVDFLGSKIENLDVYGESFNPISDKAEVLKVSRYHLAVENSVHNNYWTEKLADPVLMNNVVFYGGHSSARERFDPRSVIAIDPYDLTGTYDIIARSLAEDLWSKTEAARDSNRRKLLDSLSFHRSLLGFIEAHDFHPSHGSKFSVPPQHPKSLVKKFIDPLYRILPSAGH